MHTRLSHEIFCIFNTHWNNDLFARQAFCYHIESGLRFLDIVDDFLDLFDFAVLEIWEHFFNFQHIPSNVWCISGRRSLSVQLLLLRNRFLFEVFLDFIDLLQRFGWNRRRNQWDSSWFDSVLAFVVGCSLDRLWAKFRLYHISE